MALLVGVHSAAIAGNFCLVSCHLVLIIGRVIIVKFLEIQHPYL